MANSLLTVDMITKRALMVAHEKATFLGTINRQYDDQFANEGAGGKNGATLRIRRPNAFTRRQGSRVMDVQDQDERKTSLTVATQDGVDMRFNSAELALSIEDFSERYIEPAVSVLVSGIEADILTYMTQHTYNLTGTAATVVGSSSGDTSAITYARGRLNQGLAPTGDRSFQIDSYTMGAIVNGNKGLLNPTPDVSEAFREGYYGRAFGCDWYENERTWTLSNSDDVVANTNAAGLVTDANTDATYGLVMAVGDDLAAAKQVVGSVFTVPGCYACHPETKQAYSHLQQFVVTATGTVSVSILPQIFLTGPRQNVCSATGAQIAASVFDEATLTFHGNASAVLRQNLMYHRDAFTFVTADLPLMADAASCVRRNKDGLSMRVWKGSDIRNDELLMRIDILYGKEALRPEWACRVSN